MTHNIIKTKNYLLVVDDSKIKGDDIVLVNNEYHTNDIRKFTTALGGKSEWCKKIIAHLPLNNSPVLEGVPLLPSLEIVRYDFAEMFYNICKATYPNFDEWIEAKEYNKAKEKYKYTEEEYNKLLSFIKKIDDEGYDPYDSAHHLQVSRYVDEARNIIQSLQQPKMPVAFECEESVDSDSMYVDYVIYKPKTTTNPQGQTEWVGKYIY
jgi:hypothetical protein